MNESGNGSVDPSTVSTAQITDAINRAVREALLTHARLGNPVSTWRDGKVVWLTPLEVFALLGVKPDEHLS